jgi:hypothetical protein
VATRVTGFALPGVLGRVAMRQCAQFAVQEVFGSSRHPSRVATNGGVVKPRPGRVFLRLTGPQNGVRSPRP